MIIGTFPKEFRLDEIRSFTCRHTPGVSLYSDLGSFHDDPCFPPEEALTIYIAPLATCSGNNYCGC